VRPVDISGDAQLDVLFDHPVNTSVRTTGALVSSLGGGVEVLVHEPRMRREAMMRDVLMREGIREGLG
jgi:hypothetical protein